MIIDGRKMASEVLARAKERAENLSHAPTLRVIACGGNAATASYLKMKQKRGAEAGVEMILQDLDASASTGDLVNAINSSTEDAVIVQLPLVQSVDTQAVLDAIPSEKDADVLARAMRARFNAGDVDALLPPVVGAVREIFTQHGINPKGKRAVVIGNGWLVGNPCAKWLMQQGAEVSILTSKSGDLTAALRAADIIVSGAGSPHFIKPDMIQQGLALIDAGTSESDGTIAGDADPACAPICSIFTPVPGGVGPLAVAKLFENVVMLAERATNT